MNELILNIKTEIAAQNVDDFAAQVKAYLDGINTDLKTDDDFAQAEADCKELKAIEDKTRAAIKAVLDGSAETKTIIATAEAAAEDLRTMRLKMEKLVKAEKVRVREEIVGQTRRAIHAQIDAADECIKPALRKVLRLPELDGILDEAVKGKKTIDGLRKGCTTVLADWTALIDKSAKYLIARYAQIPADKMHLFADLQDLLTVSSDFEDHVKQRLVAEEQRIAEEKARMEAEAKAKAEAEARAKIEAEQRAKAQAEAAARAQEEAELRARIAAEERAKAQAEAEEKSRIAAEQCAAQQQTAAPTLDRQENEPAEDYRILLNCTLDEAKSIAKHIKDTQPAAFVALKKGH